MSDTGHISYAFCECLLAWKIFQCLYVYNLTHRSIDLELDDVGAFILITIFSFTLRIAVSTFLDKVLQSRWN